MGSIWGLPKGSDPLWHRDHKGLVREIDSDDGELEAPLRLQHGVGPVSSGNGTVVIPGHDVLVLDDLWVEGRQLLNARPAGLAGGLGDPAGGEARQGKDPHGLWRVKEKTGDHEAASSGIGRFRGRG